MGPCKYRHAYHQSLVYKIMNCEKPNRVLVTFEQTLDIIRRVHRFSRGLKQIVYLTGWQYEGHDSKYPAWFEVNAALKRECDERPLDSLLWLMREARKWNAVVSVHINMYDAYENSPLWDEYVRNDLLNRDESGNLSKGGVWGGEQAYMIVQQLEWRSGYAKRRIDALLELLPIEEAGTIHIDANIPRPSPYHGITREDEIQAIIEQIRYWNERGIDVTNELFLHEFAGWVPMAWHLNLDEASRLRYPASVICGGGPGWNVRRLRNARDAAWIGFFTAPEAGCLYEEAWGISIDTDADNYLRTFADEFYLRTLPWYYLNRRRPIRHIHTAEHYTVQFGGGVESTVRVSDRFYTLQEQGRLLVNGTDVFLPALWNGNNEYLAYSRSGGRIRWELPPHLQSAERFEIRSLTAPDRLPRHAIAAQGRITLELDAREGVSVVPYTEIK